MIGLVALGLVVFLSLFFGGGATSPLNFICKDFDRTLYEGKFAIAEVPAYDLTSKDSREILSFFAFERKDPYALELLEKWRNSLKAYRECPTLGVLDNLVRLQGNAMDKKFQLDIPKNTYHEVTPSPTLFFDIERSPEIIQML